MIKQCKLLIMLVLYQQRFDAKHTTDLTQFIYSIYSEWSAHLDRWHNLQARLFSDDRLHLLSELQL